MRFSHVVAFLHKWIGLIVGIQIVLWISGGVIMSWFPIEDVRGEHNVSEQEPAPLTADRAYLPLEQVLAVHGGGDTGQVTLRPWLDRVVYEVRGEEIVLVDAVTGAALSPVDEANAAAVARADFAGEGDIIFTELLSETNLEYRGPVPVWRFDFSDSEDTHLYVSPDTGRIVARRNATWRLFDFFWMLHIMDYENREDFNHPLLITASITAFVMVFMGIILLFRRLRFRDWRIVFARRTKPKASR